MKPKHYSFLPTNLQKYVLKVYTFFRFRVSFQYFKGFFQAICMTREMVVLKCPHSISAKCSRYQDTGSTDPSLLWSYPKDPINQALSEINWLQGVGHKTRTMWLKVNCGCLPLVHWDL